jgi:hypothetical protein
MQPLPGMPAQTNSYEINLEDNIPLFDFTDLGKFEDGTPIEFPDLPYYGIDHGQKTAQLASTLLSYLGPKTNDNTSHRILWTAGCFHDIGRTEPWNHSDPHHAQRSADILERILRGDSRYWHDDLLRAEACKLVANHSKRPEDGNPLAMALWDADCFEAARVEPGTPTGLKYLKSRTSFDVLTTEWAKDRARLKRWMDFRGW